MTTWIRLSDHLGAIPHLEDAKCKGRGDQFDLPEPFAPGDPATESRLADAVAVCHQCPALITCNRWVDSLTPKQRPAGVVAGRVFVRPIRSTSTLERNTP
ncbi:hypothetical protein [Mycobacterium sp. PSTR-4-N]|uniref:hypothetical protein n=1 Tax=Mycobacterium sp. PSTR-4-N TaxID=2917745 RepID=UPI001F14B929|nr:hypothetical protein [Mycobacterium sp. PSTR-4-N]MCG7597839.1 hypothetical protein [Mycobacterium sp. PSTR-4-N]